MPRIHICFGRTDEHLEELRDGSRDEYSWWTINGKADPGDLAVFYMIAPMSQFVATGTVAQKPYVENSGEFAGMYRADMVGIEMLPQFVHLREAKTRFPDWGYLRAPRRSIAVPEEFSSRFLKFLRGSNPSRSPYADESDIEGLKFEVTYFGRSLSKRLRELAMTQAGGVCSVCQIDFSKVLGGRGVRVLQVHHRKQLAKANAPQRTALRDLAVVCANCHLLLHLDANEPMDVAALRALLRSER